jgi:hypothetical protein
MATACDLAWVHLNPATEVPSITPQAPAEEWKAAFVDRAALVYFLQAPQTVYHLPDALEARAYVSTLMARSLQQSADQNADRTWNRDGVIGTEVRAITFVRSFTGGGHHDRPFCAVSFRPATAT